MTPTHPTISESVLGRLEPVRFLKWDGRWVRAYAARSEADLRLRARDGYEGWDVQHEYYSVDGGTPVEVY